MMGFFFSGNRSGRGGSADNDARAARSATLHRRRLVALCRRLGIALAAGLAVFAALQCVLLSVRTRPVVVATETVGRGQLIDAAAVDVVQVPVSGALDGAWSAADDVVGLVAQVDVMPGTPLFPAMARASPTVPDGFAVIDVRLAGDATRLIPGDVVSLLAAGGCSPDRSSDADGGHMAEGMADRAGRDTVGLPEAAAVGWTEDGVNRSADKTRGTAHQFATADSAAFRLARVAVGAHQSATAESAEPADADTPGNAPEDVSGDALDGRACTLTDEALVMELAREDDMGGVGIAFAMPAADALRVLALQEQGMIVATATG